MKQYFRYLLKTQLLQSLVLTLIPTVLFFTYLVIYYRANTYFLRPPFAWFTPLVFLMILIHLVVIFRFSTLKSPKDVDVYYALPITKKKLFLTHYAFGLAQLVFAYTVLFFVSFFTFIWVSNGVYLEGYLLLLYPAGIVFTCLLYTLLSYVFIQANTWLDGIIFIALFHLTLVFIPSAAVILYYPFLGDTYPFLVNPFFGLFTLANGLILLSNPQNYSSYPASSHLFVNGTLLLSFFLHVVLYLGVITWIATWFFHTIEKKKVEHIGQISTAYLGYRSYLPLSILLSTAISIKIGDYSQLYLIFITFIISAGYIGFVMYRRSLTLHRFDIAVILIPLILGVILGAI